VTGFGARLRNLEGRLGGDECPLCGGRPAIDFHTIHAGETLTPRPPCESCGKPSVTFVVEFDDEPTEPAVTDTMPPTQPPSKALVRRRRYCGPN
jgi:hypothetical protein